MVGFGLTMKLSNESIIELVVHVVSIMQLKYIATQSLRQEYPVTFRVPVVWPPRISGAVHV
jgi:hypothetical protein